MMAREPTSDADRDGRVVELLAGRGRVPVASRQAGCEQGADREVVAGRSS